MHLMLTRKIIKTSPTIADLQASVRRFLITENHYQEDSFREKYFNVSNANQENNKDLTNSS